MICGLDLNWKEKQPCCWASIFTVILEEFDRFTQIFCSAVLFWQCSFYTCNVWIRLVCHELKEFSFLLSGFWLLLKSEPKHYLTQQRLWWKFLLKAASSQLTVGIVFGFLCLTLCQKLGKCPRFAFVLLHFIWTVPPFKMCM